MARYWRCLDDKLWSELPDVFTEDVIADYGQPGWRREGREALCAFLRENEGARGDFDAAKAEIERRVEGLLKRFTELDELTGE
mgnify:CR=1 FL=1